MSYYRNKVPLNINGKDVIVQLDYDAMKMIGARYGIGARKILNDACFGVAGLDVLLFALVAALERHQPDKYTVDEIQAMDPQPALFPMQEAIYESLMAAEYGSAGPPEANPLKRLLIRISNPVIRFFRRKMQRIRQD